MQQKKGMSPLIATVLLIAFAVALGAMIMNWSTDIETPEDTGSTTSNPCLNVQLEISEVAGKPIFCYRPDTGDIFFNVMNSGSRQIAGVQVRTVDADLKEVKKDIPSSRIAIGDTFEHALQAGESGKLHVEVVPYVLENNQPNYCAKQKIVQDRLPSCNDE